MDIKNILILMNFGTKLINCLKNIKLSFTKEGMVLFIIFLLLLASENKLNKWNNEDLILQCRQKTGFNFSSRPKSLYNTST